ncbi:MAG: helix-turn-helix transcriptional regulator, partial [Acidobacteriota bacterium]
TSSGVLEVEEGALYPALHRLRAKGWLEAQWGLTETRRRAKFYTLTEAGRATLRSETERWREHAEAVRAVLEAAGEARS